MATFALPLPSQVIAFLLDIPDDAHAFFQNRSAILIDRGYTPEQVKAAREDLDGYLSDSSNRASTSRGPTW